MTGTNRSNIIAFPRPQGVTQAQNLAALSGAAALHRRPEDDVFWLKECAEVLNVLAALDMPVDPAVLAPFEGFYERVETRFRFYPQYYRFFLSMVLDLEDLGMGGDKGQRLCDWVAERRLVQGELSDLQRAEARYLLARRGVAAPLRAGALPARLRAFAEWSHTFALPNKKACYELTHIVFYLSDYGRRDPLLGEGARRSLEYAGLVAFLDQNHDLLAEICLALRFAGGRPNAIWEKAVVQAHEQILPERAEGAFAVQDGFHAYLVTGWAAEATGRRGFGAKMPEGRVHFRPVTGRRGALGPLSACLYELEERRRGDWPGMRGRVMPLLDGPSREVLRQAEESSDHFEAFFSLFARAAAG